MVHSCGLRATGASRYHVPCGGYQCKRDVRAPRNFGKRQRRGAALRRLRRQDERRGSDEDEAPVGLSLADPTTSNPKKRILSAIDLNASLGELSADDRRMLALRSAGHTLEETARRTGVSTSNIFARRKRLGLTLAARAGVSLWPKPRKAGPPSRSEMTIAERHPGPSSRTQLKKGGATHRPWRSPRLPRRERWLLPPDRFGGGRVKKPVLYGARA
ncbi:hypothetical protein [Sorangium sp. So ce693]|uniref:hypothetical protein n=1 Tax=Sorangium sp. So ce693 TaxID=3133318 RepID=UPI003F5EC907